MPPSFVPALAVLHVLLLLPWASAGDCASKIHLYRFGDLTAGYFHGAIPATLEGRIRKYCTKCPHSLGCEWVKMNFTRNSEESIQALATMVSARTNSTANSRLRTANSTHTEPFVHVPSLGSDTLVLRVRLGDAFSGKYTSNGLDCWQHCGKCSYVECGCDLRSRVNSTLNLYNKERTKLSRVLVVGGSISHQSNSFLVQESQNYSRRLVAMLKGLGLEVNIDHSSGPDEDFVRCSSAPVLIPGGGNYGSRASQVARVLGGQVVCPLDPKSKNATTGQCLYNFKHGAKRTCAPDGADGESKEPWASSSDTPQLDSRRPQAAANTTTRQPPFNASLASGI